MKTLSTQIGTVGLALLLAVGSSTTAASNKHGERHARPGGHSSYNSSYNRGQNRHQSYRPSYGRHGGGHYSRWYSGWNFGGPHYSPSYFGAAVVGAALTQSLYHRHNGAIGYDRHQNSYGQRDSAYSEVVGCHRIERLPDGAERRVEVPLSDCN